MMFDLLTLITLTSLQRLETAAGVCEIGALNENSKLRVLG
jgi:hypothetical protein